MVEELLLSQKVSLPLQCSIILIVFFVFSVASIVVGDKVKTRIEHYDGKSKPDQVNDNQLFKYVSFNMCKSNSPVMSLPFD